MPPAAGADGYIVAGGASTRICATLGSPQAAGADIMFACVHYVILRIIVLSLSIFDSDSDSDSRPRFSIRDCLILRLATNHGVSFTRRKQKIHRTTYPTLSNYSVRNPQYRGN